MCYAIPGKVVGLKDNIAIIDYFGEQRKVLNEFQDIKIGDYIYAQGGVLINRITDKEAEEILNFWKEQFFELKTVDKELSNIHDADASPQILDILQKINLKKRLTGEELMRLLSINKSEELGLLYETANNTRQREHDNACCVHGIIEFSNYCSNNCHYCGIRKDREIKRYRMSVEDIISVAKRSVDEYGFKALVLQSGEDPYYDERKLIEIVTEIRKFNVLIFLSIGDRSKELYKKIFEAGARGVLLRFETSNEGIFNKLRPKTSLKERVQLIKDIKAMGYVLATGFMIGLPGETNEDIINNIILTHSLKADMYSFGPLIPTRYTPLEKNTKPSKDHVLKIISITRFIDRDSKILVTTALETLDKDARREGLLAGANSLMINITPKDYAGLYSIYDDKADASQDLNKTIKETVSLLYSIGRAPTDLGI
jgi:biotin synthase